MKEEYKTRRFMAALFAESLHLPVTQSSNDDRDDEDETVDLEIDVFDDYPTNGLPPEITLDEDEVQVFLILEGRKSIVGFRLAVEGNVVCTFRFSYLIELEDDLDDLENVEVDIYQVNGHVANDYKQGLLEVGICSPAATKSCLVCMRSKKDFHWLSEMLQKHRQWPSCVPGPKDAKK